MTYPPWIYKHCFLTFLLYNNFIQTKITNGPYTTCKLYNMIKKKNPGFPPLNLSRRMVLIPLHHPGPSFLSHKCILMQYIIYLACCFSLNKNVCIFLQHFFFSHLCFLNSFTCLLHVNECFLIYHMNIFLF